MKGFVFTDEARADLFEVWSYVAEDHLPSADELERDLMDACAKLARCPGIGHRRRDLCDGPSVRFHTVRTWYLIVYEVDTEPLRILRILHGARDAGRELRGD